ncbi:MAG: Rab family GTPase, partial [Pseudomonadota bacterium]
PRSVLEPASRRKTVHSGREKSSSNWSMTDLVTKVCVLGEFAVGKTSTIARFVHNEFSEDYLTTVGVKIDTKHVELNQLNLKMVIWDIAGGLTLADGLGSYVGGSAGLIAVVDGTRPETLDFIEKLLSEVQGQIGEVPYVVLLNKSDLNSDWEISEAQLSDLNSRHKNLFITSAKSGQRVDEALTCLAHELLAREMEGS